LRKDSNGSFLDLYKATTLAASYEFPFSLANNVEYCVNLTKFTLDNTYIDIAIISNNGRSYHLLVGTPESINSAVGADVVQMIGKLWGKVYLASSSGSFEAYSFNMYSPYKQDCQVAVIGHSFVEANSIEGMKLKKFSKLLQGELGIKECGVYGRGGGTMAQSLDVLQHYVGVFYAPKYVLLCVGTNDNSMTLANWKTWANNVVSACGAINATPVFFTIPPDSGAYEGQWNSINAFIRTSGYKYVDMDKCFVDGSGNPILSDYLYDGTHPNPETHYAIFQRILADVPEILDLWTN
jgi:lysophospholipase L1-like esterase